MGALRTVFAIASLAAGLGAEAGIFRAYLSVAGSDANPCTLPEPCRLLPAALQAVDSGGEIWLQDSGNFNAGPVSVTKSVTILAVPGALGSLVASGGPALTVDASGTPSGIIVALRNLNVRPLAGAEEAGILVQGAGTHLAVDRCDFSGFKQSPSFLGSGLMVVGDSRVQVNASRFSGSSVGVYLKNGATAGIVDSRFFGHRLMIGRGVVVEATNGTRTSAVVERSSFTRLANALSVYTLNGSSLASARALVTDSYIAAGQFAGITVQVGSGLGNSAIAEVTRTTMHSTPGFSVIGAGAKLFAADNVVFGSASAYQVLDGGLVESTRDNVHDSSLSDLTVPVSRF